MSDPRSSGPAPVVAPLSWTVRITAAVFVLIPVLALVIVPIYGRSTPKLLGMPFFYWYQFLWVFLAAGFTYATYLLINRARARR